MNALFWLAFIVAVIFMAASALWGVFFIDVALVLVLVVVALFKISESRERGKTRKELEKANKIIGCLINWLREKYEFDIGEEVRNEQRFFRIGGQREEMYKKLNENHDSVVKKVIHLENRINEIARAVVRREEVRSGRGGKK